MASKRRIRKNHCGNKIKYNDQTAAVKALISHQKRFEEINLSTYKCKFCNKWHIGHFNSSRVNLSRLLRV